MPKSLWTDLETLSELDLNEVGIDNYARHPSTKVSIFGYAIDDGPIQALEASELFPEELENALWDPNCKIISWNAGFERYILWHVLRIRPNVEPGAYLQLCSRNFTSRFYDVMVHARYLSLPGKLEKCCIALKLKEGKLDGDKLKNLFCSPVPYNKNQGDLFCSGPRYRTKESHPQEWEEFKEYCKRDVEVLRQIAKLLAGHPLPPVEVEGWLLDQKINDHGMPVDVDLIQKLDNVAIRAKREANEKIQLISGIENPNSRPQMLAWLKTQGYPFNSLEKPFVNASFEEIGMSSAAAQVLELRKESAKTSDAKLDALKLAVSPDGFVRDQYSYMGAARTGRWSGHTVQLHNLPRTDKSVEEHIETALELVQNSDYDGIAKHFGKPMDVVAGLIRGCFAAPTGKTLVIADLAAIEHRVVGWVSGCEAILEVHRQGRDPYLDFAETLYKIPYDEMVFIVNGIHKCKPQYKDIRQLSKPPVLGCGFGLSGGEEDVDKNGDKILTGLMGYSKNVCNVDMPQDLAHTAVRLYRKKYNEVVRFWYDAEDAFKEVTRRKTSVKVGKVVFDRSGHTVRILLPSGRYLHYVRPKIREEERDGRIREVIYFEGIDAVTKQWSATQTTYFGRITENIVQGIARDVLLQAMKNADKAGLCVCGHVHDELVVLAEESDTKALEILIASMVRSPEWGKDLLLGADGFTSRRYRKG